MNTHRQQLLTLGLTALFTLSATGLASAQEEFNQAQRELNIMRSIFGAVLEPDSDTRRFLRNSDPESLYLAGQGMVFTFDLQHERDALFLNRGRSAALSMRSTADGGVSLWRPDAEIAITPAFTLGGQAMPGGSEEQVRLRETMQEKQTELRELQSEIQDLARTQRENPGDNAEKMKELQQRLQALNAEWQAQRNSYATLVKEEWEALMKERNAEKREQASLLISTLCDYGKTLDSLASDQHITLVFRDFEDNRDQVYVFTQEAVADCSNAENLQQSAVSYQL
ncbi:OmpH family outer membrane protein [Idiomarina sp. M1R2S28]|uniref:OmpH family outer membrane protein n=1 Tax=Idiomarina rhizosphaerae TaxID=2961572 RepID=A0A9X2FXG6_9GAMM|nr:OmpH family outer membrane protein [Idiomarina rhizosphaerae]MCP1340352.1 OmpH family outer membrane protein [Idiomarina rhizosphaerae]